MCLIWARWRLGNLVQDVQRRIFYVHCGCHAVDYKRKMSSKQACQIVKPKCINVNALKLFTEIFRKNKSGHCLLLFIFLFIFLLQLLLTIYSCANPKNILIYIYIYFLVWFQVFFLYNNSSETISVQVPNLKKSTKSTIKEVTCALYYRPCDSCCSAKSINIVFYMIDILYQIWSTPHRKLQYRMASEDLEFYTGVIWTTFMALL